MERPQHGHKQRQFRSDHWSRRGALRPVGCEADLLVSTCSFDGTTVEIAVVPSSSSTVNLLRYSQSFSHPSLKRPHATHLAKTYFFKQGSSVRVVGEHKTPSGRYLISAPH